MNYFLKSGGTCPERMYNPTLSKVIMVDLQKIHFAPNGFCSVMSMFCIVNHGNMDTGSEFY